MFSYRPPKGSCWGAAIRPRSAVKAIEKTNTFLSAYFEPIRTEGLTLNLNPYLDKDNDVPKLKARADQVFGRTGRPESLDWVLGPDDFGRVMEFILESRLNPKPPADPIWLSFTCSLDWKDAVLPNAEDTEAEEGRVAAPLFIVNLSAGGRIMFPMGMYIPIPSAQASSYEFLGKFTADAPFKMSPRHFQTRIPNSKGAMVWKKPDAEIAMRLNEVIESHNRPLHKVDFCESGQDSFLTAGCWAHSLTGQAHSPFRPCCSAGECVSATSRLSDARRPINAKLTQNSRLRSNIGSETLVSPTRSEDSLNRMGNQRVDKISFRARALI